MTGTVQIHLLMIAVLMLPEYQLYSRHIGNLDIVGSVEIQLATIGGKELKI